MRERAGWGGTEFEKYLGVESTGHGNLLHVGGREKKDLKMMQA